MTNPVIKVEDLSKYYRLGVISGGTLHEDVSRWWARKRGRPDPSSKVGDDTTPQPRGGQIWALENINLEVDEGEILGIIGRNGAGKSTLLKILSRITAPTSGRAVIKGRVGSLLEVGTGFHPELTGRENIYLNGAILGMRHREVTRKLDEIVAFAEVAKFVDTPVKRYSSGMLVRLAFAVAAHLEPEVLIVDEVLAVGDVAFQNKCLGKILDVAHAGKAVLLVSHNMSSIRRTCNNAVLLEGGAVSLNAGVEHVIDEYLATNVDTNKPLKERNDREGDGTVRMERARISSSDTLTYLDMVLPGTNITFELEYDADKSLDLPATIEIGLAFYSTEHNFVTVLNNVMSNQPIIIRECKGTVKCHVQKFPLMGGIYNVRTMIKANNTLSDMINNAFKLHVLEGDFYGSRKPNSQGRQGVYLEQTWDG